MLVQPCERLSHAGTYPQTRYLCPGLYLSLVPPSSALLSLSLSRLSLIVCRASIYARTIPGDLQQIVPRPGHPWRFWLMETDPRPAWAWGMDMHMDLALG